MKCGIYGVMWVAGCGPAQRAWVVGDTLEQVRAACICEWLGVWTGSIADG